MRETDFQWFLDHYSELYKQFGTCYVAIKNARVLGTYRSYGEAVRKTAEAEPLGTYIVQLCNGEASGYTNFIASMNFGNAGTASKQEG